MSSLLIVDRYMPHNGGSRRYYHNLARRLDEVVVLTGHQEGGREFDRTSGVKTVRRWGIRPNYAVAADGIKNPALNFLLAYLPGMLATLLWTLVEIIRRRPSVVHAGGYAFAGFAAYVLCPLLGIPYIVYAHGEDVLSTGRRRFFAGFMRRVYQAAVLVVVNSRNTEKLVSQQGIDAERICLAYPGLDDHWFQAPVLTPENTRRALGLGAEGPMLLTVGRLVAHKGHRTLMNIMPDLLEKHPHLQWVLVGTGPEEDALRRRAKELGVGRAVAFRRGLSDEQLASLYRMADIFVQPNGEVDGAIEGYGMVFLEAGAASLPVIGGDSGGVPEVIAHGVNGLLVAPFVERDLLDSLDGLLEDGARRQLMGHRGLLRARTSTWDQTLVEAVIADRAIREGMSV